MSSFELEQSLWQKRVCDRCGCDVSQRLHGRLYPHKFTDCMREKVEMMLCWNCDWDVMNGGDPFEDMGEIWLRRREEAYAYDPINNPCPW